MMFYGEGCGSVRNLIPVTAAILLPGRPVSKTPAHCCLPNQPCSAEEPLVLHGGEKAVAPASEKRIPR